MLGWTGQQLDSYLSALDLAQPSPVYWAGAAPVWFDLARGFSERWGALPADQGGGLAEATRKRARPVSGTDPFDIHLGLSASVSSGAPGGTTVALAVGDIGPWTLTRSDREWIMATGPPARPPAGLRMTGEVAWRLLAGAGYDRAQLQLTGDPALTELLLQVCGIIV